MLILMFSYLMFTFTSISLYGSYYL